MSCFSSHSMDGSNKGYQTAADRIGRDKVGSFRTFSLTVDTFKFIFPRNAKTLENALKLRLEQLRHAKIFTEVYKPITNMITNNSTSYIMRVSKIYPLSVFRVTQEVEVECHETALRVTTLLIYQN
ncbi:hypothetical protein V6N12_019395 [Hibiscus sabdariffa]|uniref:Uncharacterized protein n=1 Tax=Hibiscus sabdariffa TaxID=183260 RepID=A0ABR2BM47_9ROSI